MRPKGGGFVFRKRQDDELWKLQQELLEAEEEDCEEELDDEKQEYDEDDFCEDECCCTDNDVDDSVKVEQA